MKTLNYIVVLFFVLSLLICFNNAYPQTSYDLDNDGIPNEWEITHGLDPTINDSQLDTDNDSLINYQEYQLQTDPLIHDTDNDGLSDGEETFFKSTVPFKIADQMKSQTLPTVCYNNKQYLVCWVAYTDNDGGDIYGLFFNSQGVKVGSEFLINTYTLNTQNSPCIATDGNNFFIVWSSMNQDGSQNGIYGQLINSTGEKIGLETRINSVTDGDQKLPYIAACDSSYLIVWHGTDAKGKVFDFQGNPISEEINFDVHANKSCGYPKVIAIGNKFFVEFWDGSEKKVDGQFVSNDGTFMKNTVSFANLTGSNYNPFLCANKTSILAGWLYKSSDNKGYDVKQCFLDPDGNKITDDMTVNTIISGDQLYPFPATDGDGFLVVWNNCGSAPYKICGQFFTSQYKKIGSEFRLFPSTNDAYVTSSTASDGEKYFIVWRTTKMIYGTFLTPGAGYGTDPTKADTDNDGLSDKLEIDQYFTDPLNNDTDSDGLSDYSEIFTHNTNPTIADTDNDGLSDYDEIITYTTNPNSSDTDNDGLSDKFEIDNNFDPKTNDSLLDRDNDGLTDLQEYNLGTDPRNSDTDSDGINDFIEVNHTLTSPIKSDTDNDGASDNLEINQYSTNPNNPDTDGDGLLDGEEIKLLKDINFNMYPDVLNFNMCYGNGKLLLCVNDSNQVFARFYDIATDSLGEEFLISNSAMNPIPLYLNGTFAIGLSVWETYYYYPLITPCPIIPTISLSCTEMIETAYGYRYYCEKLLCSFINSDLSINYQLVSESNRLTYYIPSPENPYSDYAITNANNIGFAWNANFTNTDMTDKEIYFTRISNDPTTNPVSIKLADLSGSSCSKPAVSTNGNDYLIIWGDNSLFGQIVSNGQPVYTQPFKICPRLSETETIYKSVACDGNNYLVGWCYYQEPNFYVSLQLISDSGNKIGDEFIISENAAFCDIVWDGSRYLVFYISETNIYMQAVDKDGYLIGDPVLIDNDFNINGNWVFKTCVSIDYVYLAYTSPTGVAIKCIRWGYDTDPLKVDTDNDGTIDSSEFTGKIEPTKFDSDNDGIPDSYEKNISNTDPYKKDSDNDGLSDGIEDQIFGSNPNIIDTDNDGFSDFKEYIAGTDPCDNNSYFKINSLNKIVNQATGKDIFELNFKSALGKKYTISVKSNLTNDQWTVLNSNYSSQGNTTTYTDQGGGPNNVAHPSQEKGIRLYKITVKE